MSNLESPFHSSEDVLMTSDEIDSCIEECRSFIQESRNFVRCPEEMSRSSNEKGVSECFVDSFTEKEINDIRKKVFSYWETAKTQQKYGEVETSKVRLQDSEPTTQSEEAVISFEDAKSEVPSAAKRLVKQYDIEQLIEAELKDIRNSKLSKDYSCSSTEATHEEKLPVIESMDFTGIEKKAADLPGISNLELSQRTKTFPVLNRTEVLEVLLRIYEFSSVDSSERAAVSETGDISAHTVKEVQEFRKHLADEMKLICERLVKLCKNAYPSGTHRVSENVESSNSSSNTKDSSSSMVTSTATHPVSPLELSTSAYPEPTTRSRTQDEGTISSPPSPDSNSSASGLINNPVIDMAAAQPKSSTSSSSESISNTNTSSTSVSEDNNTLSGISSLPTDPRASVSSMRDVSSLRDMDTRNSVSSLNDIYPRTSVSSSRDVDIRTSVSSLKDIESLGVMSPNVLPQQLLSEDDVSDDAFLTTPLVATAVDVPSVMDSTETAQNQRRRGRSPKEDEDKNKAKRPSLSEL